MDASYFDTPRIGLAFSKYLTRISDEQLKDFDYIEVPYEALIFEKNLLASLSVKPLILHCASLSLGGYTPPDGKTLENIQFFAGATHTPWIGEHLSYILADKPDDNYYEPYSPEPYNIGYTVSPVMNQASVSNVLSNIARHEALLGVPIIIENPPLYFKVPQSDMTQTEFITSICRQSQTELLLDLTHWYISSRNFSFDPFEEIQKLPLDRVKEIHLSGVSQSAGSYWDNHAGRTPDIIFQLLELVLKRITPKAITFEYNWRPELEWFPLKTEIEMVRKMLDAKPIVHVS